MRATEWSSWSAISRSGETRALTQDWDRSIGSIVWDAELGKSILVTADDMLDHPALPGRGRQWKGPSRLTQARSCRVFHVQLADGGFVYALDSIHVACRFLDSCPQKAVSPFA
jgi:hypothetical protein